MQRTSETYTNARLDDIRQTLSVLVQLVESQSFAIEYLLTLNKNGMGEHIPHVNLPLSREIGQCQCQCSKKPKWRQKSPISPVSSTSRSDSETSSLSASRAPTNAFADLCTPLRGTAPCLPPIHAASVTSTYK